MSLTAEMAIEELDYKIAGWPYLENPYILFVLITLLTSIIILLVVCITFSIITALFEDEADSVRIACKYHRRAELKKSAKPNPVRF